MFIPVLSHQPPVVELRQDVNDVPPECISGAFDDTDVHRPFGVYRDADHDMDDAALVQLYVRGNRRARVVRA